MFITKKGCVKEERKMSTFNDRSVPNSIQQDCDEVLLMAGYGLMISERYTGGP
jgi:hypothetical protein